MEFRRNFITRRENTLTEISRPENILSCLSKKFPSFFSMASRHCRNCRRVIAWRILAGRRDRELSYVEYVKEERRYITDIQYICKAKCVATNFQIDKLHVEYM